MSRSLTELASGVKGPRPLLSREAEASLTTRQRQLLRQLHDEFSGGFAHLTMADMAAATSCSMRTLYALAPSKEELVRLVVDHRLWEIGRTAMAAITDDLDPLEAIQAYLHAAHVVVASLTEEFAADAEADPGTSALERAHAQYLVDVTNALLDEAVARGVVAEVDTAAVARVVANVGADLASAEVLPTLQTPPKEAADMVVDLVLSGLRSRPR